MPFSRYCKQCSCETDTRALISVIGSTVGFIIRCNWSIFHSSCDFYVLLRDINGFRVMNAFSGKLPRKAYRVSWRGGIPELKRSIHYSTIDRLSLSIASCTLNLMKTLLQAAWDPTVGPFFFYSMYFLRVCVFRHTNTLLLFVHVDFIIHEMHHR